MAVYIDDMNAKYGRMTMCHMIADSTEELLRMARLIGIDKKWIQKSGTTHEHFDVSVTKKKLALDQGAIPISTKKLGKILLDRRAKQKAGL